MSAAPQLIQFDCGGDTLVGLLSEPSTPSSDMGVLIVVGGPQYRCGSHRQFVQLARALAEGGHHVMRFDVRGMGDATGDQRSFSALDDDIGAAVQAFRRHAPGVKRLVLWGLCDGASAALLYWQATRDPSVSGMILLNPWVRSEASLAKAQVKQYYVQRLAQRDFWLKLARGGVAASAAKGLLRSLWLAFGTTKSSAQDSPQAEAPFQQRMAQAWSAFPGRLMLIVSGRDITAREFLEYAASDKHWAGLLQSDKVSRCDVAEADHTFSTAVARREIEQLILDWLAA